MPRDAGFDADYQKWMDFASTEPLEAARQFMGLLKGKKLNRKTMKTIQQLEQIASGDEEAWQYSSTSPVDAVQFAISNAMMSGLGMGVLPTGRPPMGEAAEVVGNLISEDIDPLPFNPLQLKCKRIAESYGLQVYLLVD